MNRLSFLDQLLSRAARIYPRVDNERKENTHMDVILLFLTILVGFGAYRLWIRVDELTAQIQQPGNPDSAAPQAPSLLAWLRQLDGRR